MLEYGYLIISSGTVQRRMIFSIDQRYYKSVSIVESWIPDLEELN
jgi:hypothetical protein